MTAFSPYPQRYLSVGYSGEKSRKCTSSSLEGAVTALWRQNGIQKGTDPEVAREQLRWWGMHTGEAYGIWGKLPDGRWLGLDPEEAQDVIKSVDRLAAYEAALEAPSSEVGTLVYQMRSPGEDGNEAINDYPTIRAALTAFAKATGFPFSLDSNFTWLLSSIGVDGNDLTLCARLPGSIAAVPVPLRRAEKALASNHAELHLASQLRQEFVCDAEWGCSIK